MTTEVQATAPAMPAGLRRARFLRRLMVPALYTLLALIFSWPLPLHFGSRIQHGGDAMQYMWNLWWFRQAAERGVSPFHTDVLYHPYGVSTAFTTLVPLESAATVPLQWLGVNLIAGYNLLVLLSSIIGAWAMYALALRLTGSRPAALVAGLAYGWSPYHSAHLMGHLNLASHQWLPLFALAMMRTADAVLPSAVEEGWLAAEERRRPWLWALVAGLAGAAIAYTEWTYALMMLLWALLYLAYRAWPVVRRGLWRPLARLAGPLLLAGAVAAVLSLPMLLPMLRELRTATYMILDPGETLLYSADPSYYLAPSELHPIHGPAVQERAAREIGGNPAERVVTTGFTVLVLSLLALLAFWRQRAVRFWALAMVCFAIISLGPILRIHGNTQWTTFHATVLLPYAVLYKLPVVSVLRTPSRFAVLVSLSGAVLVAYGLAVIVRRWRRAGLVAVLLTAVAIAYESWTQPPLVPLGGSTIAAELRADPAPGAVLDLPLRPLVDYLWYQTAHERPIVGGHLSRQPPDPFAEENPAMVYLQPTTPVTDTTAIAGGKGLASLQQAGIRFVVVHWWATDDYRSALSRKLELLFPGVRPRSFPDEQVSIYRLPDAGSGQ